MSQSIWKETEQGDWKLFFNTNITATPEQEDQNLKKQTAKSISHPQASKHILGTLYITSSGIGRLIKLEDSIATICLTQSNQEETFNIKDISNSINLYLKRYDNNFINWYRITLPVNGHIEQVKQEVERLKLLDMSSSTYTLMSNGTELKDEYSFEQLDLKQNCKMLMIKEKMNSNTLKRYKVVYEWWYGFNNDGISFSTNKKVKLTGIGLYCSHENKVQNGEVVVFEENVPTVTLAEVIGVEVPATKDKDNAVYPVMFQRPVTIKAGIIYMVEFKCVNPCSMFYGTQGTDIVNGEKNVDFSFKLSSRIFRHGTNVQSGNFPEFYYHA